jgi:membrane protein
VIALSHWIDPAELLAALSRYLEWLLPGQSGAVMQELRHFLAHREVVSGLLLATMLFFSSLAFTVLENAMSVIFVHRVAVRRRRFVVSALLPYGFVLSVGLGLMLVTLVSGGLQALGEENIELLGREWSLVGLSGLLLWGLGFVGEVLLLTSLYLVLPVGRLSLRHALVGGVTAAVLWELTRRVLVWYLTSLSQVNVVYGSLTTAIVVLLSLELAATLLLFGAQVIAEFERLGHTGADAPPIPFHTD